MSMIKCASATMSGAVLALVAAVFAQSKPLLAQKEAVPGKTIVVSGIPGCDCTTDKTECYCVVAKDD